jgi:4-hydroxy-tetrahydrodipicolinate synthase
VKNSVKKTAEKNNFSGVFTALITPFQKGRVDFKSLKKLVRHQLDGGVQGFVVNGTTAESPTLSKEEVSQIFKTVRKEVGKKFPLVLGTGSNSTAETIKKTKMAVSLGADAALVVVPYYNKPPQRGMVAHFQAVAKSTKKPIILYNVPGRTVVSMTAETVLELAKIKNIVGIKEASGNLQTLAAIKTGCPPNFLLSSGDDATAVDFISEGGHGVISVISHVIPNQMQEICKQAASADLSVRERARENYKRYNELNRLLGVEANPIPVKMMLHYMGIIASPELRLPMMSLTLEYQPTVRAELKKLGII